MKKIILFCLLFSGILLQIHSDYSLQTDSFKTEARAKSRMNSLSKLLDLDAVHMVRTDLGEKGVWYRVRYGRFSEKKDAMQYIEILKKKDIASFLTLYHGPPDFAYTVAKTENAASVKAKVKETPKEVITAKSKKADLAKKQKEKTDKAKSESNKQKTRKRAEEKRKEKERKAKTEKEVLNETLDFKIEIVNNIWIKAVQERDLEKIKRMIPKYLKLAEEFFDSDNLYKTYYMVSHCYLELKDNTRAITYIDKAIDYAPRKEKAALLYEKGFMVYIFVQDYDKALNIFKRVSIEFPGSDWEQAAILNIKQILTYKVYKHSEEGS